MERHAEDPERSGERLGIAEGAKLAGQPEAAGAHFDGLSAQAAALNERLSSAAMFLPSYQLRSRQTAWSALTEEVAVARAQAVPKKKFAFSKRKKKAGGAAAAPEPAPEPEPEAAALDPHADEVGMEFDPAYLIKDHAGEVLCKTTGEIAAHDYAVTDVSDCTIYLLDVVGTLYIKRVKNCRIVCGPIRGSVHVDEVHDSTLSLCARQVRMHKSTETKLHIFCASDPIIEHSNGIGIGKYGELEYADFAAHMAESTLEGLADRRCGVQDFNWLRQNQSPNWCVMEDSADAAEAEQRTKDFAMLRETGKLSCCESGA